MKYSNIILGGLVAFAGTAVAMPTQEETKKVEPLVLDLMKDDQVALKSGKKSRVEVAESAMALADKADSEAAKLLLMKGAFNLYVRAGEFDKAIETLQALQAAIPDIPPANMANIIEASLRVVSRKNGGQLYRLLDETKTRMRYTSAAKKMEKSLKENPNDRQLRTKLAEHYAYLGKWDKALENFVAADGKAGAIAKAEQGGEAGEKAADFWWSYPTGKADELVKSFRTHAAKLYEDTIADGKITGLNKVQAEKRVKEMSEQNAVASLNYETGEHTAAVAKSSSPSSGKVWQEKGNIAWLTLPNGEKIKFIKCPKGRFNMLFHYTGEGLLFPTKINYDYWISDRLITEAQKVGVLREYGISVNDKMRVQGANMKDGAIESFTARMQADFGETLPKGFVFRLPSVAEFEYAYHANTKDSKNPYFTISPTCDMLNRITTLNRGAGQNEPNAWGIHDMICYQRFLDRINPNEWQIHPMTEKNNWPLIIEFNGPKDKVAAPFFWTEESDFRVMGIYHNNFKDRHSAKFDDRKYHFHLVVGPDLVSEWKSKQKK